MNHVFPLRRALLPCLVASLIFPSAASASGFALIETNARGQGNAYAGAAAHTPDASTIFFNPAGMSDLEGDLISIAGHLIIPHAQFNDDGSTASEQFANSPFSDLMGDEDDGGRPALVPNLYWVKTISEDTKFGIGVNSLFGLAVEYDDDWIGRYHGVSSDLMTLNINPSMSYRVNENFSIGGGLNFLIGSVILTSAVDFGAICLAQFNATTCQDLGALPQQADGFADLEADNFDDIATGFNLGMKYKINKNSTIGIAYRSGIELSVTGEADFTVPQSAAFVYAGNLFVDTDLEAEVDLPGSFSISYAHVVDQITYLADITWTGWSSFEELRVVYDNADQPDSVTTEDWDDTMRYSFGIDYQYTDDLIYRVGVAYDETPVPNSERRTPRLPGSNRTWVSFGLSKELDEGMSVDIGYSHLFVDEAEIENEFESSVPTLGATLIGDYDASINIFSAQLNWRY